jgi:hypothetical protein
MAVVGVRYRPDHKSFGLFMKSAQVALPITVISHRVAAQAKKNTPRGDQGPPHMADQYKVSKAYLAIGRRRNVRVVGVVSNSSRHAAAVEFGNSHMKGRRPLGRAAAEHGEFKGSLE